MMGDWEETFWIEGQPHAEHEADLPLSLRYGVWPDYLKLMQIPLLRGRFFTDADNEHSSRVVVVDEASPSAIFLARIPSANTFTLPRSSGGPRTDEIIGVVGHIKQFGLQPDQSNVARFNTTSPSRRSPMGSCGAWVRGLPYLCACGMEGKRSRCFRRFAAPCRRLTVRWSWITCSRWRAWWPTPLRQRFAMMLFSIFAAGALLLASIGIYGVLSYVVGQRTREVGIRMALGAQKGDVVQAVLRDGAGMTLPGIGIGLVVALGMTRLMSAMLFGVTPTDVVTFASVPLVLCLVAMHGLLSAGAASGEAGPDAGAAGGLVRRLISLGHHWEGNP